MIINALCDYYDLLKDDASNDISSYGYQKVNVSYCATLSLEGQLKGLINLKILNDNRPQIMETPKSMKKSGIASSPVCDNFAYIFGVDGKNGEKTIHKEKFACAKELHQRIFAEGTTSQSIAICKFFENWDLDIAWDNKILLEHYSEKGDAFTGNIVFRLEGESEYFHNCKEIIDIWQRELKHINQLEDEYISQCTIIGTAQPIARIHKKISGVKGASTMGASLVCYKKDCDKSYNLKQSYNSSVSELAMFKYTTALQHMLSGNEQKIYIGTDTAVFWAGATEKEYVNLFSAIMLNPNEEQKTSIDIETQEIVKGILSNGKRGIETNKLLWPDTQFFILGMSPNAGRISVRFFHKSTFGDFCDRIRQHYEDILIYGGKNAKKHISLSSLIYATVNANSKDKQATPLLGGSIMRAMLSGGLYPIILVNQVIGRVKAERSITHARAAAIKGYLVRKSRNNNKTEEVSMYLNEKTNNTAYVLGRTFALLEMIQKKALGNINATIKDKYFSRACSNPALVFPNLLKLSQHHLSKIDGNYWDIKLGECIGQIQSMELPKTMNMDNQGRFILGYYQQVQKLYEPKNKNEEI